jgi:tetratricopeptide (TPR) repeat protein
LTTQYQPEDKNRIKRQKTDLAIKMAQQGKWEDAVQVNLELLGIFPEDSETLNRLGKAYLELRQFNEAKNAYERALKTDPGNSIAQKNLQRLAQAVATAAAQTKPAAPPVREKPTAAAPSTFIEETGKTGVTNLVNIAPVVTLAKLTAGDLVQLELDEKNQILYVKSEEGERLGQVEPKLALRLIRFIQGGNRYSAAVTSVTDTSLKIIIREVFQHSNNRGRLSFPPKTAATGYRAYIKDSVLSRYGFDEDDEMFDTEELGEEDSDEAEEEIDLSDEYNDENEGDDI